jgi:hypothetical protein
MVTTSYVEVSSVSGVPKYIEGSDEHKDSEFQGSLTCAACGTAYLDIEDSDDDNRVTRRCSCGNTRFMAKQRCYHDVVVNEDNIFLRDDGISESESPYGTYSCTKCFKEYEELDCLAVVALVSENEGSSPAEDPVIEKAFEQNKLDSTPQRAHHTEWEMLSGLFSDLLSQLLGREIFAEALREEYYYWKIVLSAPLSPDELEKLFVIAQASGYDREQNEFEDFPITELSQELCSKIVDKLLPFDVAHTRADDEGVWFIG